MSYDGFEPCLSAEGRPSTHRPDGTVTGNCERPRSGSRSLPDDPRAASADYSTRSFTVEDEDVDASHFEYIQKLLSGESFVLRKDMRRSLITICRRLGNRELEQLLFSLTLALNSSPSGAVSVDLWDFVSAHQPLTIDSSQF
jgi:hypothetical protein